VVDRALAKLPDHRFENAAAMAAALRGIGDSGSEGANTDDEAPTLILPSLPMRADPPGTRGTGAAPPDIDDPSLATIERRLARYLGPMAAFQLRRALNKSRTAVEFCELLSSELPEGAIRDSFLHDAMALLTRDTRADGTAAEQEAARAAAEVDVLTRALTQVMGPIGPLLVRRVQARTHGLEELQAGCAAMIDSAQQRLRFSRLLEQYRTGKPEQTKH
jgi:hypothetical protein